MFLDRYVLLEPIGQGSVAVVYQAEDTLNNVQVAVKLLEPSLADNHRAHERLRHPAEIMSLFSDPGVPTVYDYGTAPLGDGSSLAYCVLELLTGEALDSRLLRGPLSWLEAVRVAATVADVLTLAHAQNIALRVLAPTSVLLTAEGVKIVDFDAAMIVAPTRAPAPEAVEPRSRRRRASTSDTPPRPRADRGTVAITNLAAEDVHALGCLLDQMLGGTGSGSGLPVALVELLLRCLSDPAHRPDAATASMELWGMLTPGLPVAPAHPDDEPASMSLYSGRRSAAVAAIGSRPALEPMRATAESAAPAYAVPESTAYAVPESTAYAVPESTGYAVPESTGYAVPESTGYAVPESTAGAVSESAAQARAAMARAALDRPRAEPVSYPPQRVAEVSVAAGSMLGGHTSRNGSHGAALGASGGRTAVGPQVTAVHSGQGGRHRRRRTSA
jgi:serine/threonine-protein kinase